mgnify:CR=1 FL=1
MQRVYGTAFVSDKELKAHLTQIEEAKKRDHRKLGRELGLFTFHPVGAGRGVLARQGHDALQHARELHARGAVPGRLRRGEDAARLQQGAVGALRPLGASISQNMFLIESEGETMSMKPMNCPGTFPDLREPDAQLPRSAGALSRADAAAPQRGVGRAVGADPRPPVLAGRRALLRRRRSRSATRSSG